MESEAVMALFAPDPTLISNFTSSYDLEEERLVNIWNAAQGTRLETDGCSAAGENTDTGLQRVECVGANYDALVQAVDATPVPTTVLMSIGADGIAVLSYSYRQPDFNHVADPFDEWMAANQPHVYNFGSGSWETVEEAEVAGKLRAHYAAKWATYLEANGCTYLDGC